MGRVLAVAVLITMAVVPTYADTVTLFSGQSATFTFTATSGSNTFTGLATFSLSGSILTIQITNTSGPSNTPAITGLGFDTTPTLDDANITSVIFSGQMSNWQIEAGTGIGLGVGGFEVRTGNPGSCQQGDVICAGQSGSVQFTITGVSLANGLTIDTQILHIQTDIGSFKPTGTLPPAIPEPASMLLFGSGLLGIGALVRRLKR